MSVKEYSLKFTQLSKYSPTFVSYSRARINKFVMGVYSMVDNEFGVLDPMESSRSTVSSAMGFYSNIALTIT